MYYSAFILGICQFLFMSATAVGIAFNGLVGEKLAPTASMSTLPFFFVMAGTTALTLLMPKLILKLGYRKVFFLGALFGAMGGAAGAFSLITQSFAGFCFAGALMGLYQASALYYRFAAADAQSAPYKSNAIAYVLSGGIFASLIGPLLGRETLNLLNIEYAGAYLVSGILAVVALPIILTAPMADFEYKALAPLTRSTPPLSALMAMLLCTGGYSIMLMVMLASPLAMSKSGFHAHHSAGVIQWHLLGMFAPSLITGKMIAKFGLKTVALTGVGILAAGCFVALGGSDLHLFHISLLLVGIGWNLTYMSGSTMLVQLSDPGVRAKLQSINEFLTFAVISAISGITGWIFNALGWIEILSIALSGLALMASIVAVSHKAFTSPNNAAR